MPQSVDHRLMVGASSWLDNYLVEESFVTEADCNVNVPGKAAESSVSPVFFGNIVQIHIIHLLARLPIPKKDLRHLVPVERVRVRSRGEILRLPMFVEI